MARSNPNSGPSVFSAMADYILEPTDVNLDALRTARENVVPLQCDETLLIRDSLVSRLIKPEVESRESNLEEVA